MYSHVRDAGRGLRVRGTRIGGVVALDWRVAPWTVLRKTWPVWIAASGSFISVSLYGKTSGAVLVNLGDVVVISQGSLYLALATFLRVAAIAVPGVILALGLDPTDWPMVWCRFCICRRVSCMAVWLASHVYFAAG